MMSIGIGPFSIIGLRPSPSIAPGGQGEAGGSVPTAPSDLTATYGDLSIAVAWTDNSSDELYFSLERAPDVEGVPGAWAEIAQPTESPYEDSPATGGTYHYRVLAVNASGSSDPSNSDSDVMPALATAITFELNSVTGTVAASVWDLANTIPTRWTKPDTTTLITGTGVFPPTAWFDQYGAYTAEVEDLADVNEVDLADADCMAITFAAALKPITLYLYGNPRLDGLTGLVDYTAFTVIELTGTGFTKDSWDAVVVGLLDAPPGGTLSISGNEQAGLAACDSGNILIGTNLWTVTQDDSFSTDGMQFTVGVGGLTTCVVTGAAYEDYYAVTGPDGNGTYAITTVDVLTGGLVEPFTLQLTGDVASVDDSQDCCMGTLNLSGIGLTELLLGFQNLNIDASDNSLDADAVDAVLVAAVGYGLTGGSIDLTGNAVPSATGLAAKATLEALDPPWTVLVDEA